MSADLFLFSFFPIFPPFFPLAHALVFTTAVWFNDVDVLMAVFWCEENWERSLKYIFKVVTSIEGGERELERKRENSNLNSKILFSKDCSLGSFRPL